MGYTGGEGFVGVRLGEGMRTGIFLDQRDNRTYLAALTEGKRVLNCFSYTRGFAIAALAGGAADAGALTSGAEGASAVAGAGSEQPGISIKFRASKRRVQ